MLRPTRFHFKDPSRIVVSLDNSKLTSHYSPEPVKGGPKFAQEGPSTKLAPASASELSREYTDLRRILETAPTKFGDVTADLVPKELWTKNEHAINQAMQEEVNRIAGKTVEPILASDIRYEGVDGIRGDIVTGKHFVTGKHRD